MLSLVGDIETDGFLAEMTQTHCIVLYDRATQKYLRYNNQKGIKQHENYAGTIDDAVALMNGADELFFHYGHGFDYPAMKQSIKGFAPKIDAMYDTVTMATAVYRNIKGMDFGAMAKGRRHPDFAKMQLVGKHSLKAWGYRLGELKTTIADEEGITDWSVWTPEMEDYCEQDVRVTVALLKLLLNERNLKLHPWPCHQLDNRFQHIMARQERQGIYFDEVRAAKLCGELQSTRIDLEKSLREVFPPFYKKGKEFTPKRDNKKSGYVADTPLTKVTLTEFNPGSRDHIQNRLQHLYGWEPTKFGADGKATVDESVLKALPYPTIKPLLNYLKVNKILGSLSDGKQNWMKHCKDGRIHGRINGMGAVTWRCTHSHPNMGQVPSVAVDKDTHEIVWGLRGGFGADCRSLFTVPKGHYLAGHDGSGLELRCLGHYMARYDGGVYADEVVNGDVHTLNQKAIGLYNRNNAKTWIYAFLYGAGDFTLGMTVLKDMPEAEQREFYERNGSSGMKFEKAVTKLGTISRASISDSLPALGQLIEAVKGKAKKFKKLRALDGRELEVRAVHASLNTVLQSAGALIMKRWLVILDEKLQAMGLTPKQWRFTFDSDVPEGDYEFVANVHDEAQTEITEAIKEAYDQAAVESFPEAGDYYQFRCPIAGEGKIGKHWAETH